MSRVCSATIGDFSWRAITSACFAEFGIHEKFVQDNHSYSRRNVLRGLHYQIQQPQGKLVRVITGEILDVVLDLRQNSPTFGKWELFRLSGDNKRVLWVPVGFAHGFCVVSEIAHVTYKATDFYAPEHERTVAWNDPALRIDWQLDGAPTISVKDQREQKNFRNARNFGKSLCRTVEKKQAAQTIFPPSTSSKCLISRRIALGACPQFLPEVPSEPR